MHFDTNGKIIDSELSSYNVESRNSYILNSCCGLVCVIYAIGGWNSFILNHSTREMRPLPRPLQHHQYVDRLLDYQVAFGFDFERNDYCDCKKVIQIYTFCSNSWKERDNNFPIKIYSNHQAIYLNDAVMG